MRLLMLVAAAVLASCSAVNRNPLPESLLAAAEVPGFDHIRFWGDQVSPAIRTVIVEQYSQVRNAVSAGYPGLSTTRADFLAISGGGGDGAFAAGVLKGWSERGSRPVFEVVTGVSTGALAAPFAFLGPGEDGTLEELYTAYGDADIYSEQGILGLLGPAINDSAPLRRLIERYMTDQRLDQIAREYRNGRRLLVQTTNLDAQRPVVWDLSAVAASGRSDRRDMTVQILLASAAIPAVFPPVRIAVTAGDGRTYDELHVDGGVTSQLFFAPPQVRLAQFEAAAFGRPRSRTLHVLRNGKLRPDYKPAEEKVLALATRSIATLVKYQGLTDLRRLDRLSQENRGALRYTAIPDDFRAVPKSEFDKDYMRQLFDRGREVGRSGQWSDGPPALTY